MHTNKPYDQLTICDPFMFGKVSSDPRNAEIIISSLLNQNITINNCAMEHHIQLLSSKKYVRLDLFAIDENGTNYDAEMQNKSTNKIRQNELPKRARYYQSMLDGEIIDSGVDYLDISNSYIIFICDFDPFNAGLYQYTFVHKCKENATIELNDGATVIFYNTTSNADSAPTSTKNMLEYFSHGTISDSSTRIIDNAVSVAREKEEWRQEYMLTFVHDKDVYSEGHTEGRKDTIIELVRDNLITIKEGAQRLNISEASLIELINNAK